MCPNVLLYPSILYSQSKRGVLVFPGLLRGLDFQVPKECLRAPHQPAIVLSLSFVFEHLIVEPLICFFCQYLPVVPYSFILSITFSRGPRPSLQIFRNLFFSSSPLIVVCHFILAFTKTTFHLLKNPLIISLIKSSLDMSPNILFPHSLSLRRNLPSVYSMTLTTTCVLTYCFSVDTTLFEVPCRGEAGS